MKILERDDGMEQSDGRRGGERWLDSGCISKAGPAGCADRTLVGRERTESRAASESEPERAAAQVAVHGDGEDGGRSAGWGPGHQGNRIRFGRVKSETL